MLRKDYLMTKSEAEKDDTIRDVKQKMEMVPEDIIVPVDTCLII